MRMSTLWTVGGSKVGKAEGGLFNLILFYTAYCAVPGKTAGHEYGSEH